jgi:AbrB family looped-hinge helix DNA binding protein
MRSVLVIENDCLELLETDYIIIVVDKLSRPCYYDLSINRVYMGELYHAKLNVEGRIVIPAACRKQVGLQAGEEVLIKVIPEGLLLTSYEQAMATFQDQVSKLVGPGVSLVDELITERRTEAAKEDGE